MILDAAGGNSSPSWGLVQPEIAQSTRVCAYDRAGMGWSERGPAPRDMNQHVAELHALSRGPGSTRRMCWSVTHMEVESPGSMPRSIPPR